MKQRMKPREMQLLWEVSRTGSVTAAADRVAMTQPAASALLRGVEERLGFALFARQKRRLVFTTKGRALLPEIANALAALDSVWRLTEALRSEAPQRVVIGSVTTVAATLLPAGVARLRERLPHIDVSVRTAMSLEIKALLADQRVDFGLVVRETPPGPQGCLRIARLPLYCVAPPHHPLAAHGSVSMSALARHPYVSLGRQFTVGGAAARMLESLGERYAPTVEVMQYSTACAFVQQGGCVAILDALAERYAGSFGLVARPIQDAPQLGLDLLWSPLSSLGAHAQAFAEGLSEAWDGGRPAAP
jgi:DNA-binding transcriptional LysR family regulator